MGSRASTLARRRARTRTPEARHCQPPPKTISRSRHEHPAQGGGSHPVHLWHTLHRPGRSPPPSRYRRGSSRVWTGKERCMWVRTPPPVPWLTMPATTPPPATAVAGRWWRLPPGPGPNGPPRQKVRQTAGKVVLSALWRFGTLPRSLPTHCPHYWAFPPLFPHFPGGQTYAHLSIIGRRMVPWAWLEHATCGLEVRCSIQLSYQGNP